MKYVFGSAFTGTALFLLGLRMVGKVQKLHGFALLVPGILIAVKLLALPLVTREVVSLILQFSQHNSTEVQDLSTYGFLYGTFPSAPSVFVYATSYSMDVDLIACAMVACTFLSAPLMFASAKMVIASNLDPKQFMKTLNLFEFDISIAAVLAAVSPPVSSMSLPIFSVIYLSLARVVCLCQALLYLWLAIILTYCLTVILLPTVIFVYCFLSFLFVYSLCRKP
ncbi:hypothetical protein J6590_010196 [Homalodisca vitripennis]|nr:hypothetical protein J6590_010196 [Homalodisca vitripennis]